MAKVGGNPQNLKPWKKGQSGNPAGKPKLPNLSEAMAKLLGGADEESSGLNKVLKALEARALKGDTKAAEILLDRGYGKAKQGLDLSINAKNFIFETDDGEPDKANT